MWRVTGAATASPADAITAIAAWQLLVALSEELYYRGLIQNGAYHAVGAATGSGLVGDAVSLLGTSALFAVAHAGFVQDVEDGEGEMSQSEMVLDWITDVAPFGAMLALEFAVTGGTHSGAVGDAYGPEHVLVRARRGEIKGCP